MPIANKSIRRKTQADGEQTISLSAYDSSRLHQIHVEVEDAAGNNVTPTAGILTISIRTPGSNTYITLSNGTINMHTGPLLWQFKGFASHIKVTPASFDADKYYNVYLCAGGMA